MEDPNGSTNGANTGDPNTANGDNGQGADGSQDDTWNGEAFDAEKAKKLIGDLRKSERTLKSELSKAQGTLKEREDAEKTELERAQARVSELEEKIKTYEQREREATLRSQVAETAQSLGAHYPEDMYALVQSNLEVGDDGKVRNAEETLKALKQSRPALFRDDPNQGTRRAARSGAGSTSDNDNVSGDMNSLIRQRAGIQ